MENLKQAKKSSEDCIFCTPGKADFIVSEEKAVAAMFPRPFQRAHIVIAPKQHVNSMSKLTDDEVAGVGSLCRRVVGLLEELDGVIKVYIAAFGDRDPHFHFHLLPRFEDDPSLGVHAISSKNAWRQSVKKPSEVDQKTIREHLKKMLDL